MTAQRDAPRLDVEAAAVLGTIEMNVGPSALVLAGGLAATCIAFAAATTPMASPSTDASSPARGLAHAKRIARLRRNVAKKQCADMQGDEKKDCLKNARREGRAALKEAMPTPAAGG